jgi:signal transduction histidine kinase
MTADESTERAHRKRLNATLAAVSDLRRGLERQASYLMDVVTPDARRRRARQKLADRFDAATSLVAQQAERRGIRILNEIDRGLRTPPMFSAEVTTVFANLLTNAVKAAGTDGLIRASATIDEEGGVRVRLENTGVVVKLSEAERWFRPFESTTVEINPVLGQGMGLGLPITRSVLKEYGADLKFVRPSAKYATAIEIAFPA